MLLQDQPDQIQSQPAASCAAVSGALFPIKGIEQAGQRLLADLHAGIFHDQDGAAFPHRTVHPDFGPGGRVEGRVGKQISHRLFQQGGIPGDSDSRRDLRQKALRPLL